MKTKEAIERVKARFDKWALDEEDLAALQALGLVPMESKDERIRKALIHLINEQDGFLTAINGISVKDIIAYLEKQKEQNLEDIEDKAVRKYMKLDKFTLANMLAERDKTNAEVIDAFESIEEQPAEWSEADDAIYTRVLDVLGKALMGVLPTRLSQEDIEWFKSLPERFNLQPKQEWSEEDKRAIDRACVALRAYSNGDLPEFLPRELLGYADRLQALLLQPPHWRPSKEQMEVLEYYMHALMCTRNKEILFGLYNDLKKLCGL